jgi:hypothetical protein
MKLAPSLGVALFILTALPGFARAQAWTQVKNIPSGTNPSTCLLLTDGTVMCQSNEGSASWLRLTPDNTGSYENGIWTSFDNAPQGKDGTSVNGTCNPCQYAPTYFASAVLPDGKVVIIGGEYNTNSTGSRPSWSPIGFLFDPTKPAGSQWSAQLTQPTGTFVRGNGDTVGCIGDAQSVITQTGTMLIANVCGSQILSFDESTLTFSAVAASGTKADGNDEENWTILPNGKILVVDAGLSNSFEIYDPAAASWNQPIPNTTAGITLPDVGGHCNSTELGPTVARPNGTIIQFPGNPAGQTAIYTIATGTWAAGPTFPSPSGNPDSVADGPASLLVDGHALVMASPACVSNGAMPPKYSTFNNPVHFYDFDGTNLNDVTPSSPGTNGPNAPNLTSFVGRMLLLPSGHVLVTHRGDSTTDVWTYTPAGGPDNSWRPGITTAPSVIGQGVTYTISGTMFNGFSQGASYGDDAQMATNWPLVRITNTGSGHVRYARTHDHSRMGIEAVGDPEIVTTSFDVPADLELGASTLVVVTNGIASQPVNVTVELGTSLAFTGASATSADFNDPATVQATLTSAGSPVAGETVKFVLGSGSGTESCSGVTDPSGMASCPITPNQAAGAYTLTATFNSDATYAGSTTSTGFTILHEQTSVAFTGSSATNADFDDAATVQIQLLTDVAPLANKPVSISLGAGTGTETCSGTTDPSGLLSCPITPNQVPGPYTITATFAGDAFYSPSNTSAAFTVTKEQTATSFTVSSPTVIANGHSTTFSAALLEDGVTPIVGRAVTITIGAQSCITPATDATGTASCPILISQALGPGTVTASFAGDAYYLPSSASEAVIVFAFLNSGSMVIGNLDGTAVAYWGANWANSNALSGGPAPNAFKGFASAAPQVCAGGWTSNPGDSSVPPATVPSYMGVLVSTAVGQSGSAIAGDAFRIVVVQTNAGYAPDPGHAGTGTVIAEFCHR